MTSLRTLTHSSAEIYVRGSRFIAIIQRVQSESEIESVLTDLKSTYSDSTHICYAYRLMDDSQAKAYDDGEPSHTGGAPLMSIITAGEYRQVLIAVVRYFGGTKLGVGGLVRAYTDAGKAAESRATAIVLTKSLDCFTETDYSLYKKLSAAIERGGGKITDTVYGQSVGFSFSLPIGSGILEQIKNLSAGKAEIKIRGEIYENYQV